MFWETVNQADVLMDEFSLLLLSAYVLSIPGIAVVFAYLLLRLVGKIQVNQDGWHASETGWRGKTLIHAVRLFSLFQPLMCREAAIMRVFARDDEESDVSEVVVELVVLG